LHRLWIHQGKRKKVSTKHPPQEQCYRGGDIICRAVIKTLITINVGIIKSLLTTHHYHRYNII
jgi:hypothetical protein